jgi:PAS domain S-box-containing protein
VIVNNLPIGFSLVDRDGIILEFNPAAERLTDYSKEEVIGKSHFEIIHGSKDPNSCPLFTHVFEEHTPSIAVETVLKKKDGEAITLLVVAFPLFDTSGDFIGGAELFRDISELKRLEREHKNLLSMFAHDMKNPVVAAGGFLTRLLA